MHDAPCTRAVKPGDDLRAAIVGLPEGGVLCFEPGTYPAPIRVEQSCTLRAARPGGPPVVLDAGGRGTVLATGADGAQIVLDGLELRGGRASEAGGAVRVEADAQLLLRRCTLAGNHGGSAGGGAIWAAAGNLTLQACRVQDNQAESRGAAIVAEGLARVALDATLVVANTSAGAAIVVDDGARLAVRASTVAGNAGRAAIELRGTTTRAPELEVRDAILAHAGPVITQDAEPPRPRVALSRSLLAGTTAGLTLPATVRTATDAGLQPAGHPEAWAPQEGSPARRLATPPGAEAWPTDLAGRPRGNPATAGALE